MDEESLKSEVCELLEERLKIYIEYVDDFDNYKFEEFVSELP